MSKRRNCKKAKGNGEKEEVTLETQEHRGEH